MLDRDKNLRHGSPDTFAQWLIKFKDVDRPIGDLAQDYLRQPWPEDLTSYEQLRNFFSHKDPEVRQTFENAYVYYLVDR